MNRNLLTYAAFFLLALPATGPAEPVTSDRIAAGLPPGGQIRGEIIELDAGADRFIAIFQPTGLENRRGGIVLLHDQGTSANSLEVMRPLRLGLADAGWDTLSLQLPQAHPGEAGAAWRSRQAPIKARLQSALNWLRQRELLTQAIVALGDSGAIALQFASAKPPRELKAVVLVSTPLEADAAEVLGRTRLPVLDVYAERDRAAVVETAPDRRRAAAEGEAGKYTQRTISGARPGFFGLEDSLLSGIRSWLAANTRAPSATAR